MLRRNLGDTRVAYRIWQLGLPSITDPRHEVLDTRMLQSGLDDCLRWYVSLANAIVIHQSQTDFEVQLSQSSLKEEEILRQLSRREALQTARDDLRRGATLANQRDSNKRSYDEMNDTEQKTLEDYDTGRTKRAKLSHTIPRMQQFRSSR